MRRKQQAQSCPDWITEQVDLFSTGTRWELRVELLQGTLGRQRCELNVGRTNQHLLRRGNPQQVKGLNPVGGWVCGWGKTESPRTEHELLLQMLPNQFCRKK